MAFASKVKAGSMAIHATMRPTRHAPGHVTTSNDRVPVIAADTGEAGVAAEFCETVETRGQHGAEGHPA